MELLSLVTRKRTPKSSPMRLINSLSLVSEKLNRKNSLSSSTQQSTVMTILSLRRDFPDEKPLSERQ